MLQASFKSVKTFELDDRLLPSTFIVVRIDGKGFRAFCDSHSFTKPNDKRALDLMNAAALAVMQTGLGREVALAFGESDEYSFLFRKDMQAYSRRARSVSLLFI